MNQPLGINPFPGLRPFTQEEDYLFFGREEQTIELLERLSSNRFVAVVGTSGSGKSSLVRCGLLSELLGGKMLQAGAAWEIAVTHPGGNPLAILTDALLDAEIYDREEEHAKENLLATLSRSHFGLVEAIKQANLGEETNFLLVVDQFEEIFRFHEAGQTQKEAANEFVSILLEAVAQAEVPIYIVLTMRSDFIGECGQFEGLAEMVNRGEFLIPRLNREQYKRVIEGPIKVAGGQIAPRLLQRLLNDLGQQADQLPCLQHALMRTWDLWSEKGSAESLDLEDYRRVGGMAKALSLHADEIYDSLASDRQRQLCADMYQALTVQETENRGIRRPQRLGRLCQILEVNSEELIPIIDAYRQPGVTFLMPTSDVELTDQTIIDISHESLMRVWTRLRHWVDEEAQAAGIYLRLSESASLYDQGKVGLYRNPELGIALAWREAVKPNAAWAERYKLGFESAMSFLDASEQAAVSEEKEREAVRQRELEQAQRLAEAERQRAAEQAHSAVRLRQMVRGLGIVAMVAITATIFAWLASQEAKRNAQAAFLAQQETENALKEVEKKRVEAENAEQAARTAETLAKENAVEAERQRTAAQTAEERAEIRAYDASLAAAVADLERNDSRSLRRRLDNTPEHLRGWEWDFLWNESDRSLSTPLQLPPESSGYQMEISQDGVLVASRQRGGGDWPIRIHDTRTGDLIQEITTFSSSLPNFKFSSRNRYLAYQHNGTPGVQIFDLATGDPQVPGHLHRTYLRFLGFDPQEEHAIVADRKGVAKIFQIDGWNIVGELPTKFTENSIPFSIGGAVSPDGQFLVVGAFSSSDLKTRVINLQTKELVKEFDSPKGVRSIGFDHLGDQASFLAFDGSIKRYNTENWESFGDGLDGAKRRFSMDLVRLDENSLNLTFDSRGEVLILNNASQELARLRGKNGEGTSLAVDEAQGEIVTAYLDGSVIRWDLHHRQVLSEFRPNKLVASVGRDSIWGCWPSSSRSPKLVSEIAVTPPETRSSYYIYPRTLEHNSSAMDIAFSPDAKRIAVPTTSGWGRGQWRVYDRETGLALHTQASEDATSIAWSGDGQWILLATQVHGQEAGRVRIHNANSYEGVGVITEFSGTINDLLISSDSQTVVAACEDGTLSSWSLPDGKRLRQYGDPGHPGKKCLTFSPDGRYVVAGCVDGSVIAWNPTTGEELFQSQIHGGPVSEVIFTAGGERLLTASDDQTLRCIDPVSWREIVTLHFEDPVSSMAFTSNETQLAILSNGLRLLDVEAEEARSQERKAVRDARAKMTPIVDQLHTEFPDLKAIREKVLSDQSISSIEQKTALRLIDRKLSDQLSKAYDQENAMELTARVSAREILGNQLSLQSGRGVDDKLVNSITKRSLDANSDVTALQKQIVFEYLPAMLRAMGLNRGPEFETTNGLAWMIVRSQNEQREHYLYSYFGISKVIQATPNDAANLNTLGAAEYRVGLYLDAVESAIRSNSAFNMVLPHNLAVVAMAQHKMGKGEAAQNALSQLDKLMAEDRWKADSEAQALYAETKDVLQQPVDKEWDEFAAWDRVRQELIDQELHLDKIAKWEIQTTERYLKREGDDPLRDWRERATAAKSNLITAMKQAIKSDPERTDLAEEISEMLLPKFEFKSKTLVSTSEKDGIEWHYTINQPPADWMTLDFDDSMWKQGPGGFGTRNTGGFKHRTTWSSSNIWLRKSFSWEPTENEQPTLLRFSHDDAIEIFINGQQILKRNGWTAKYNEVPLLSASLQPGQNTIAVHCHQDAGGQHVDVGLAELLGDPHTLLQQIAVTKLTDPWIKLAQAFHLTGDLEGYEQILQQHPEAALGVGDLYAATQEWELAIDAYSSVIEAEAPNPQMLIKRARAYMSIGGWDLARKDWQQAVNIDTKLLSTAFNDFRLADRYSEAAEFGRLLIAQNPEVPILWLQQAPLLILANDFEGLQDFQRSLLQKWEHTTTNQPATYLTKVILIRPEDVDLDRLPIDVIVSGLENGQTPQGLQHFRWNLRGLFVLRKGDPQQAVTFCTKALELPHSPLSEAFSLIVRTMAHHQLKHKENAIEDLNAAQLVISQWKQSSTNHHHHDLLIAEILYDEAEGLVQGTGK